MESYFFNTQIALSRDSSALDADSFAATQSADAPQVLVLLSLSVEINDGAETTLARPFDFVR